MCIPHSRLVHNMPIPRALPMCMTPNIQIAGICIRKYENVFDFFHAGNMRCTMHIFTVLPNESRSGASGYRKSVCCASVSCKFTWMWRRKNRIMQNRILVGCFGGIRASTGFVHISLVNCIQRKKIVEGLVMRNCKRYLLRLCICEQRRARSTPRNSIFSGFQFCVCFCNFLCYRWSIDGRHNVTTNEYFVPDSNVSLFFHNFSWWISKTENNPSSTTSSYGFDTLASLMQHQFSTSINVLIRNRWWKLDSVFCVWSSKLIGFDVKNEFSIFVLAIPMNSHNLHCINVLSIMFYVVFQSLEALEALGALLATTMCQSTTKMKR